jgi:hypothetical protein
MASLGCCSTTVRHPLDAIRSLQDDSLAIGAVLAPARNPWLRAVEFFAFLKDVYPLVRRIAYAKHLSDHAEAQRTGLLDAALTYPTSLDWLAAVLQPPERLTRAGRRAEAS